MPHESVFHLVYRSLASTQVDQATVEDILKKARAYNPTQNLTGLLIFRDQTFLQLLEGSEVSVMTLYQKILKDSRHTNCSIMMSAQSQQRIYEQWSMAYVDGSKAKGSAQSLWDLFDTLIQGDESNSDYIQPILKKFLSVAPRFLS